MSEEDITNRQKSVRGRLTTDKQCNTSPSTFKITEKRGYRTQNNGGVSLQEM